MNSPDLWLGVTLNQMKFNNYNNFLFEEQI
jgi:hypothetical protein